MSRLVYRRYQDARDIPLDDLWIVWIYIRAEYSVTNAFDSLDEILYRWLKCFLAEEARYKQS